MILLMRPDTSVTKIDSSHSPRGPHGEKYLASGVRVSMRLWDREPPGVSPETVRDYEVVGFVIEGKAELELAGAAGQSLQRVSLGPGDSYVVPRGAPHRYRIIERFTAVEATSPPFQVHGRDLDHQPPPH
jgi:quercetin dioxygenase-like cupin family protein